MTGSRFQRTPHTVKVDVGPAYAGHFDSGQAGAREYGARQVEAAEVGIGEVGAAEIRCSAQLGLP
jgi:hypothetical protein